MCLHSASPLPVPGDTAHVARLAFPHGNLLLSLRDKLGPIFDDGRFAHLFPAKGQPAEAPWHLALVPLLQFAGELPDRQAADAVRSRIDWKYLLGLPLADPGFPITGRRSLAPALLYPLRHPPSLRSGYRLAAG